MWFDVAKKKQVNEFIENRPHLDSMWVCDKHRVMVMGDDRICPSCELGVESRPEWIVPGGDATDMDFRNRIEWETLKKLVPIHKRYLASRSEGIVWIGVMGWPRHTPLPSGYNEPERYFNVWCYQYGHMNKVIANEESARKTIETLENLGF